jgi:hypothetical protein
MYDEGTTHLGIWCVARRGSSSSSSSSRLHRDPRCSCDGGLLRAWPPVSLGIHPLSGSRGTTPHLPTSLAKMEPAAPRRTASPSTSPPLAMRPLKQGPVRCRAVPISQTRPGPQCVCAPPLPCPESPLTSRSLLHQPVRASHERGSERVQSMQTVFQLK